MKQVLRFLALLPAFILFNIQTSKASHVPGANITYECVGLNQYLVTLTLFEDCGTAFQSSGALTVNASNSCGFGNQSVSLTNILYQQEVSQLCPAQIGQSECSGGSLPGYYMHQWQGIMTLPGACNAWTFWYALCCRNTSTNITSASSYDIYVETVMNSVTDICNNSAVFNAQPIPYVCINQAVSYNMGATDIDGDSLVYSFIPARDAATTNLPYAAGYSFSAPIAGAVIDPQTGLITFTPTIIGNFVFAVLVEEYDTSGNIVGSIIQDFQIQVINCSNIVPETPVGGMSNFSGAANQTGPTSIEVCEGDFFCFDLVFTDDDATQILNVTSNIASVLPTATISQSGTNPVTVNICYTSQPGDPSFASIAFTVQDNACPIAAFSGMNVDISVLNNCCMMPLVSQVNETCAGNDASILAIGQGAGPWDFEWANTIDTSIVLLSQTDVDSSAFNNLSAGTYLVAVTDTAGCTRWVTVNIVMNGSTSFSSALTMETCSGFANGAIAVTPATGTSPYTVIFSDASGPLQTNNNVTTTVNLNNLAAGSYTIEITDAAGCSFDSTVVITSGATVIANGNIIPETCFEYDDASINGSAAGGTGPYSYVLTGPVNGTSSTGVFTGLSAGTYTMLASDVNGCSDTTVFTVINTPEVTAGIFSSVTTGVPPLSVDFTNLSQNATDYVWNFGDGNTSTLTNPNNVYLQDSVYTVMLIASNGPCVDTAYLTITTLISSLSMPNVFSPNGDGTNDIFTGYIYMNISEFECVIYNRWGMEIRTVTNLTTGWDGKDEGGKMCSDGVYLYIVKAKGLDGKEYDIQGHVTLLTKKN
jgi:large repetitive protein